MRRAHVGGMLALAMAGAAWGFGSHVQPAYPTVDDSITVVATGMIGGGDHVTDTAVTVRGDTVRVLVTVDMCTGICPLSIVSVELRLPLGRLSAGVYRLITTTDRIYATVPADTMTTGDTTGFVVYPSGVSVPRVTGLYYAPYESPVDTSGCYVTNGDTISLVGVLWANCCAKLVGEVSLWDDTALEVTVRDTATMMCRCADVPFLVTAALTGAADNWMRMVYRRSVWDPPEVVTEMFVNRSAPALCVNLAGSGAPGFCFFVDSTWATYEVLSPLVGRPQVIRLGPNTAFSCPTTNELYADSIAYAGTTLEDFEDYSGAAWTVQAFRDGSQLEASAVDADGDHWLKLAYSNALSGSCSNYLWRSLSYGGAVQDTAGLRVRASLKSPAGALPVQGAERPERAHAARSSGVSGRGLLRVTADPAQWPQGATLEVRDVAGRLLARAFVRPGEVYAWDTGSRVAGGVRVVTLRDSRGTAAAQVVRPGR